MSFLFLLFLFHLSQLQLKVFQTFETLLTCQHQQSLATLVIRDLGPGVVELVGAGGTEARVVIRGTQLLELLLDRTPEEKSEWVDDFWFCMHSIHGPHPL